MLNKAVFFTFATRILIIAAGFLSSMVTARVLGPEGRGVYFFGITLAMMISQFGNLGLHSSNTFYVAKNNELFPRLGANSLWITIGVSLMGIVVAGAVYAFGFFPEIEFSVFILASCLGGFSLFFLLGTNLLVGIEKFTLFNGMQILSNSFSFIAILLAGFFAWNASGFLSAALVSAFLTSLILFYFLNRFQRIPLSFDRPLFRQGISYAFRAYLISFLGFLVLRSNVLILQAFSGPQELGYFSIATQITDSVGIFPMAVATVLFPALVKDDKKRFGTMVKNMLGVGGVMIILCVIAALLASPFINLAFGSAYVSAIDMLYFMLPGTFFLGLTAVVSQYLASIGFPIQVIIIWGLSFALVLGLGIVFIPEYGGQGAAIIFSTVYAFVFLLELLLAISKRNQIN